MNNVKNGWIEYWNQDNFWVGLNLYELNADAFLKRIEKFIEIKKHDRVLEIGCGPGILALKMSGKVKSILAVDVAPNFVEMARTNCMKMANINVEQLGKDYTDLTVFGQRFSLLLCISVVQYYNNIGEVESLIQSAKKIVEPGGKMLIADLNLKRSFTGFVWDAFCSVYSSVQEGYAPELFKLAWKRWATSSQYRDVYVSSSLLEFNYDEIEALIEQIGLKSEIIRGSLSIYANRPSLLIHF